MAKPTKHNIAVILASLNGGATFAGMDKVTEVKTNKTIPNPDYVDGSSEPKRIANPHFERITKTEVGASVVVGADYQTMVKKRLAEQQVEELKHADELREQGKVNMAEAIESNAASPLDFTVGERKWGTRIDGTPLIEHKGEFYIDVIYLKSGESVFRNGGKLIDEADIEGYTPSKASAQSQGGVDNKVIFRTIKLDSIVELRINKQKYTGAFYYDPSEV